MVCGTVVVTTAVASGYQFAADRTDKNSGQQVTRPAASISTMQLPRTCQAANANPEIFIHDSHTFTRDPLGLWSFDTTADPGFRVSLPKGAIPHYAAYVSGILEHRVRCRDQPETVLAAN